VRMSLQRLGIIVAIALAAVFVAITLWSDQPFSFRRPAFLPILSDSSPPPSRAPKRIVMLYFVNPKERILQEEPREIEEAATTTEEAKQVLGELAKGPDSELQPAIPRAAQVRNLFLDASGTAYVDFDRGLREGRAGGAQAELYAVFSIVDTLVTNFPRIKRVRVLVEGTEIPTSMEDLAPGVPLQPRFTF
jgi:spore germination protein GerM